MNSLQQHRRRAGGNTASGNGVVISQVFSALRPQSRTRPVQPGCPQNLARHEPRRTTTTQESTTSPPAPQPTHPHRVTLDLVAHSFAVPGRAEPRLRARPKADAANASPSSRYHQVTTKQPMAKRNHQLEPRPPGSGLGQRNRQRQRGRAPSTNYCAHAGPKRAMHHPRPANRPIRAQSTFQNVSSGPWNDPNRREQTHATRIHVAKRCKTLHGQQQSAKQTHRPGFLGDLCGT